MTNKHIWFIRHGESVANAGGVSKVSSEVPLTEKGIQQAKSIAHVISEKPPLIITSPYERAQQTADPTIKKFPESSVETWPIQEFTFLSWTKLGPTTAAQRAIIAHDYWDRNDPDYNDGEDAESFRQFIQRVDETIDRICNLKHGMALLFTHKLFLNTLFYRLDHPDIFPEMLNFKKLFADQKIINGSITHYEININGSAELKSVTTDHLGKNADLQGNSGL